jgi:hypothetical protein
VGLEVKKKEWRGEGGIKLEGKREKATNMRSSKSSVCVST